MALPSSLRRLVAVVVAASTITGLALSVTVMPGAALEAPQRTSASAVQPGRAMWLWNWSDNASVIAFAQAHQVTEIFAYVSPGFTNPATIPPEWSQPEWPLISNLAVRARTDHILLSALGGDPSWVPNPSVAVAWADEVVASGLFSGVHLDLEPWALAAWTTNQAGVIAQTVSVVAQVRAALPALPLELSLPWWLYQYRTADGTPLDLALLAYANSAAIITYFNNVGQIESFGAQEQADAASLSKPARLAVETDVVQPSWLTFAGTSQPAFTQILDQIDAANAATPGYLGVAVEDYTGWAAMPA